MNIRALAGLLVCLAAAVLVPPVWGQPATLPAATQPAETQPARGLVASLPPSLRDLAADVLARNPDLARARREAVAAELRAPQVRSLPDPMATLTPFLVGPETRVGPQQLAAGISQRLPWFGKLALREQAAVYAAAAARAEAEAQAVALVTETRRLYYELAFLATQEEEVRADRATLEQYEALARARYASGVGLEQAVVKLQAEITKDDNRLLEVDVRRAALLAGLNALRDRGPEAPLPPLALPDRAPALPDLAYADLVQRARSARPEVAAARARLAATGSGIELAKKAYYPDVTLGLTYTLVGNREDAAGRATPPEGNGDDIIGLTAGINLPVWHRRLDAGVEEAAARQSAAEEALRSVDAGIGRTVGELVQRIPLTAEQYALFDRVLTVQAEEALRSAESAYSSGNLGALDLLDAERVRLEVKIAAARTLADLAIALARLEGAVAAPLPGRAADAVPTSEMPQTGNEDPLQPATGGDPR